MNLDDAITIETFPNRISAEMAAGLLESEGIEAMVLADDAGGAYPMLQYIRGVRLLVAPEDEAEAREILAAMETGEIPEAEWNTRTEATVIPFQKKNLESTKQTLEQAMDIPQVIQQMAQEAKTAARK